MSDPPIPPPEGDEDDFDSTRIERYAAAGPTDDAGRAIVAGPGFDSVEIESYAAGDDPSDSSIKLRVPPTEEPRPETELPAAPPPAAPVEEELFADDTDLANALDPTALPTPPAPIADPFSDDTSSLTAAEARSPDPPTPAAPPAEPISDDTSSSSAAEMAAELPEAPPPAAPVPREELFTDDTDLTAGLVLPEGVPRRTGDPFSDDTSTTSAAALAAADVAAAAASQYESSARELLLVADELPGLPGAPPPASPVPDSELFSDESDTDLAKTLADDPAPALSKDPFSDDTSKAALAVEGIKPGSEPAGHRLDTAEVPVAAPPDAPPPGSPVPDSELFSDESDTDLAQTLADDPAPAVSRDPFSDDTSKAALTVEGVKPGTEPAGPRPDTAEVPVAAPPELPDAPPPGSPVPDSELFSDESDTDLAKTLADDPAPARTEDPFSDDTSKPVLVKSAPAVETPDAPPPSSPVPQSELFSDESDTDLSAALINDPAPPLPDPFSDDTSKRLPSVPPVDPLAQTDAIRTPAAADPHASTRPMPAVRAAAPVRTSTSQPPEPGALPLDFGPYRLLEQIDRDEMGALYRGHDPMLDRPVAVRMLDPSLLADRERAARALDAPRRLAALASPHLASIFDIERDDEGRTAIVSEWLDAGSLASRVGASPDQVRDWLIQAARGLDAAARAGVAHGDLKPTRLLLDERGLLKVAGFGLGRPFSDVDLEESIDSTSDATPRVSGTPEYIAPELIRGKNPTTRSDLYSLGAVVYELISGRPPFRGRRVVDQLLAHLSRSPKPLRRVGRCSQAMERIVHRMLAKDPERRFRSFADLLAALEPLVPSNLAAIPLAVRVQAAAVDLILFPIALGLLTLLTYSIETLASGLAPVLVLLRHLGAWGVVLAYYLYTIKRYGQTPGKMAFRCRLHDLAGRRPTKRGLALRFALSYAPPLLLLESLWFGIWSTTVGWWLTLAVLAWILADAATAMFNAQGRALHDLMLDTWVIQPTEAPTPGLDDYVEPAAVEPPQLQKARERGDRIGDHTVVLGALGAGGMGEVLRGFDERLDRQVAVKVLTEARSDDEEFDERFRREARILAGLSHRNLVQIYGFGHDEDRERNYFTMELIQGRSLAQELAHHGPLDPRRAIELMIQAAEGLRAAHDGGVIHRDIKPSNMILTADGGLKLVDFGLAKHAGKYDDDPSAPPTSTGIVLGTPHYMSPEQGRGELLDHRSDIYGLGASFYHLLTGRYPFHARSPMALVVKHCTEPFPLKQLQRVAPPPLCQCIRRMMAKDPEHRQPDYPTLIEELKAILPGHIEPANVMSRAVATMTDVLLVGGAWAVGLALALVLAAREAGGQFALDDPTWRDNLLHHFPSFRWAMLAVGLLPTCYMCYTLARHAATPGMRRVKLHLLQPDGARPSLGRRLAALAFTPGGYPLWIGLMALASLLGPLFASAVVVALVALPVTTSVTVKRMGRTAPELLTGTVLCYRV